VLSLLKQVEASWTVTLGTATPQNQGHFVPNVEIQPKVAKFHGLTFFGS